MVEDRRQKVWINVRMSYASSYLVLRQMGQTSDFVESESLSKYN